MWVGFRLVLSPRRLLFFRSFVRFIFCATHKYSCAYKEKERKKEIKTRPKEHSRWFFFFAYESNCWLPLVSCSKGSMAICFLLGGNSFFFLFAWIARLTHLRIIDLCFSCPANGLALYTNRAFMNELCHPRVKFPRVKWNLIRMNNRAFVRATSRHSIQFHLGAGGGGGA